MKISDGSLMNTIKNSSIGVNDHLSVNLYDLTNAYFEENNIEENQDTKQEFKKSFFALANVHNILSYQEFAKYLNDCKIYATSKSDDGMADLLQEAINILKNENSEDDNNIFMKINYFDEDNSTAASDIINRAKISYRTLKAYLMFVI